MINRTVPHKKSIDKRAMQRLASFTTRCSMTKKLIAQLQKMNMKTYILSSLIVIVTITSCSSLIHSAQIAFQCVSTAAMQYLKQHEVNSSLRDELSLLFHQKEIASLLFNTPFRQFCTPDVRKNMLEHGFTFPCEKNNIFSHNTFPDLIFKMVPIADNTSSSFTEMNLNRVRMAEIIKIYATLKNWPISTPSKSVYFYYKEESFIHISHIIIICQKLDLTKNSKAPKSIVNQLLCLKKELIFDDLKLCIENEKGKMNVFYFASDNIVYIIDTEQTNHNLQHAENALLELQEKVKNTDI